MQQANFRRRILGAILANLRADGSLAQGELAARLDPRVEQSSVSRIESGATPMEWWKLQQYIAALANPRIETLNALLAHVDHVTQQLRREMQRTYGLVNPAAVE